MTVLEGLKEDPGGSKASKSLLLLLLPPLPSITLRQLSVERLPTSLEPKVQVVPSPLSKRSYRREHCEKARTHQQLNLAHLCHRGEPLVPPSGGEGEDGHAFWLKIT